MIIPYSSLQENVILNVKFFQSYRDKKKIAKKIKGPAIFNVLRDEFFHKT